MTRLAQMPVTTPTPASASIRLTRAGVADGCRVIEVDEVSGETLDRVAWLADGGTSPGCAFLTTLRGGSWAVPLVAGDLLLSYVSRSSPSSMCVQTAQGRQRRVDAGGLMLCSGIHPALRRRKGRAGPACEVIDLVLPAVAMTAAVTVRADDATRFVNTHDACIRVLLGRWGTHGTLFDPLPGLWLLDVDIIPGGRVELDAHSGEVNVLLLTGALRVDGQEMSLATRLMRCGPADAVSISSSAGASALLFSSGRQARTPPR